MFNFHVTFMYVYIYKYICICTKEWNAKIKVVRMLEKVLKGGGHWTLGVDKFNRYIYLCKDQFDLIIVPNLILVHINRLGF